MQGMGNVGALKRAVEKRHLRVALCFIALCMFCLGAVVSATDGDEFLNVKEAQLIQLAKAVQSNDALKCELLKTCTAMPCSRNTCFPQEGDVNNYTCIHVSKNKYCNASDGGLCYDQNFDYTRSYVRTAANTDFGRIPTIIGTCAQRALDPVFQNISTPNSLLVIYFGSIHGSWRGFPGSDQNFNDPECNGSKYDTRHRPWYRASTSVPKVVAILVDAGERMSTIVSSGLGQGTILENVKNIVREFLNTLSAQDYVNIIMFNSANATLLSSTMVLVKINPISLLPELDSLKQSLQEEYKPEDQPGTSNVTQGINAALSNFGTNYPDAAKIIVILTDGKFATDSNIAIPTSTLTSLNVKVFLYKIPVPMDANLFLGNTPFANELCSIGGSFELIQRDLSNPVLALNSFFTFTATLHTNVSYSADFSETYPGFEEIEGNITTISRPVFGANTTLLGVVAMDIFINSLGNLEDLVKTAILQRTRGRAFKSANFLLTNADCSLQVTEPRTDPCEAGVAIPQNGGFCLRTDKTSTIKDLACCKSCANSVKGSVKGSVIGPAVGVPIGAIIVLVVCLFLWLYIRRRRERQPDHETTTDHGEIPTFRGNDNDPPIQLIPSTEESQSNGERRGRNRLGLEN